MIVINSYGIQKSNIKTSSFFIWRKQKCVKSLLLKTQKRTLNN
ncbi:hypothetical protein CSC35_3774 [Enterobacter hormaechei]|nr:hypothetical protein CSC35_3774 [Enterobacter hormaechei]